MWNIPLHLSDSLSPIIINGPTASGKTAFAIEVALYSKGEIINCDNAQSYCAVPIGTAQPNENQKKLVPHHLFGHILEPVAQTSYMHKKAIEEKCLFLMNEKKRPIIVGGSSFYIYSLFFSYSTTESGEKIAFRSCGSCDKGCWNCIALTHRNLSEKIHPNDSYRIEKFLSMIKDGLDPLARTPHFSPLFDYTIFNITPEKEWLHKKINERCESMVKKDSWIDEAKSLSSDWKNFVVSKNFLGYKKIYSYLDQNTQLSFLVDDIAAETRQYAKRQMCFSRRMRKHLCEIGVPWIELSSNSNLLIR